MVQIESRIIEVDLYFNPAITNVSVESRKAQLKEFYANRRIPLYGAYANKTTNERYMCLNLTNLEVDFEVLSIDWQQERASLKLLNPNLMQIKADMLTLSFVYHHDQNNNLTSLDHGILESRVANDVVVYDIQPQNCGKKNFDFGIALRILLDGIPVNRVDWKNTAFVSMTPGIGSITPEKLWSPANRIDAETTHHASVAPYFTKNTYGEISVWVPTTQDLIAQDWEICDRIYRKMQNAKQVRVTEDAIATNT